jgi:phosphoribosylaminoimidazole-succinocarboxamide synthase
MKIDLSYPTLRESLIPVLGTPVRGKVRDVYRIGGNRLLLVATDRISVYDVVFGQCVPSKGYALTQSAIKGFELLKDISPSHFIASPDPNVTIVLEAEKVYPIEAIVRGTLSGSGWSSYQETGMKCGIKLPPSMRENELLKEPIFTATTKAPPGQHDEDLTFDQVVGLIGWSAAEYVRDKSIKCYKKGVEEARKHGGLIADTKFEWGVIRGFGISLLDEALTHDSSRYVRLDDWEQAVRDGRRPKWHDKQVVRDYARDQGFDGTGTPPHIPDDIIEKDIAALNGSYELLVGEELPGPPGPPSDERIIRNLQEAGYLQDR